MEADSEDIYQTIGLPNNSVCGLIRTDELDLETIRNAGNGPWLQAPE